MQLESPQCSDNDDSYDTGTNNKYTIDAEPIDLKQVNLESQSVHEDISNNWDTSRLIKTKAFRIKDILGLDDNEKFNSAKSMSKLAIKSPSIVPCMYM